MRDRWLQDHWDKLRRRILQVAMGEIDILLAYCTVQWGEQAAIATTYIGAILDALNRKCRQDAQVKVRIRDEGGKAKTVPQGFGGPWDSALGLFHDTETLCLMLVKDQKAICGAKSGVKGEAALSQKLQDFLSEARRHALSPDAPNRARVWDQLRGLEKEIERETGSRLPPPLTDGHLQAMQAKIAEKMRNGDKNLPRNLEGLREYYLKFDPRCQEALPEDDAPIMSPAEAVVLARDEEANAVFAQELRKAHLAMPSDMRRVFDHARETETNPRAEPKDAFCARTGISIGTYARRLNEARKYLGDALDICL